MPALAIWSFLQNVLALPSLIAVGLKVLEAGASTELLLSSNREPICFSPGGLRLLGFLALA